MEAEQSSVPSERQSDSPSENDEQRSEETTQMEDVDAWAEQIPLRSDENCLVLYTDASVARNHPERYTGISAVFAREGGDFEMITTIAPPPIGPGPNCSTCPEMLALTLALHFVIGRRRQAHEKVVICTDSARCIRRIHDILGSAPQDRRFRTIDVEEDNPYWQIYEGRHPLGWDYRHPYFGSDVALSQLNINMARYIHEIMHLNVEIVWVPSHSGIEGNERADWAAGFARFEAQKTYEDTGRSEFWTRMRTTDATFYAPVHRSYRAQITRLQQLSWVTHRADQPPHLRTPSGWLERSINDWYADSS